MYQTSSFKWYPKLGDNTDRCDHFGKWNSNPDRCTHIHPVLPLVCNAAWTVNVLALLVDNVIERIQYVLCNLHLTNKHPILCARNVYCLRLSPIRAMTFLVYVHFLICTYTNIKWAFSAEFYKWDPWFVPLPSIVQLMCGMNQQWNKCYLSNTNDPVFKIASLACAVC